MFSSSNYKEALRKLRKLLSDLQHSKDPFYRDLYTSMVASEDRVLKRYQSVFSRQNLPKLTGEKFHSFLLVENNSHWVGLPRNSPKM